MVRVTRFALRTLRNDKKKGESAMNFDDTPQEAEFRSHRPQMDRGQRAEEI